LSAGLPLRFAVPSTQFPTPESPASSLPPSHTDIRSALEREIECWVPRPGQALSLVLSLGQQSSRTCGSCLSREDEPGSRPEDGQDDGTKMRLVARSGIRGSRATKVAPTDEGGHTGPPLRNAMQPSVFFLAPLSRHGGSKAGGRSRRAFQWDICPRLFRRWRPANHQREAHARPTAQPARTSVG
jgi:hypothetical protein